MANSPPADSVETKGPLAWMAVNPVAANLLMLVLLVGGALILPRIKQEVFPEFELEQVLVSVAYPGASPKEVEEGVVLAIEEEVRSIDGVKEVKASAVEGAATVQIELLTGSNTSKALADVKSAVDRITSFPKDVERPVVSLLTNRRQVISLVFYGDQGEQALRNVAERARDELLGSSQVTYAEVTGVRPLEISVEISQETLRRYGLTLRSVANSIASASIDVPAGGVKTARGEVLLRTKARRERGLEYRNITLLSRADGSEVRLGDVAKVRDGFAESDQITTYNGKRAVLVDVYRVGDETPITVTEAVRAYLADATPRLPAGVELALWRDQSEFYRGRIELLLRNASLGLVLVLIILGLFLAPRLAFWVTMGIPISFVGALLFMPMAEVSINMISLFAFIVTLGMVVDDAIVVGEAVYTQRRRGLAPLQAAIAGVREVGASVTFSILTTCIAFVPMLFVPGASGKFFRNIPLVVILVLLISLVESLFVLPAHLAGERVSTGTGRLRREGSAPEGSGAGGAEPNSVEPNAFSLSRSALPRSTLGRALAAIGGMQARFSRGVEAYIENVHTPLLRRMLLRRYLVLAVGVAMLIASLGLVSGGRIAFTFLPKVESDLVTANLRMPYGTPFSLAQRKAQDIQAAARTTLKELGGGDVIDRGIIARVGEAAAGGDVPTGLGSGGAGSHLINAQVYLVPSDQREVGAKDVAMRWREHIGEVVGAEALTFRYSTGATAGEPINIRLSHPNETTLHSAAADLAEALRRYNGVIDVDDGFAQGKEQLDFRLRPAGRALGLSEADLADQVRSAFFGAEALRLQRGRDEVRVYVRLPRAERRTLHTLEGLILRTPNGGEIPLGQAAEIHRGRAYTEITRTDGRRTVEVTGDVVEGVGNANSVMAKITSAVIPDLVRRYPGLSSALGGEQKEQSRTLSSLSTGFSLALVAMFALLAIAFSSYLQPIIVMSAIPFGFVGALLGHLLMGYDLSLMSMFGIVALSGVVVNDSLILIDAVNTYRRSGMGLFDAVVAGGARRFRPIVLTSLTTFFGLVPMILERSLQAKFLIPMAISLGFGVLGATVITLVLVPAGYLAIEDVRAFRARFRRKATDMLPSDSYGDPPHPRPANPASPR